MPFLNRYEKKLDKDRLAWYNTGMKKAAVKMKVPLLPRPEVSEMLEGKFSTNLLKTKSICDTIKRLGEIIHTVSTKFGSRLRIPVIAGGAIRDMTFGFKPKDYDIFFDTSSFPEDERDDEVLLFGTYALELMRKNTDVFDFVDNVRLQRLGMNYSQGEKQWGPEGSFCVYETPYYDFEVNWDAGPVNDLYPNTKFQFIGHADKRLTDEPVTFLEAFDYPLVKCLYDPMFEEFRYADSFLDTMQTKSITVTEHVTRQRLLRFFERYSFHALTNPWKMVDQCPAMTTSKYYTTTLSTANVPVNNFFRQANNANPVFIERPLERAEFDQEFPAEPDDLPDEIEAFFDGDQWGDEEEFEREFEVLPL